MSNPRIGIPIPSTPAKFRYSSYLVALLIVLAPLVASAPASLPSQPFGFISNSSLSTEVVFHTHCVNDLPWIFPKFTVKDCEDVVDLQLREDSAKFHREFQFVSPFTTPFVRPRPPCFVPRRYTVGTCTLVIAMIQDFPDSQPFPRGPPGPHPGRDKSTFEHVRDAAVRI